MTDLVPSLPTRTVTISTVLPGEASAAPHATITFTQPCDLHVAADDRIIQAGSQVVEIINGSGEVELPVYDPAIATTQDGSPDWVIVVTKSWHPSHPYAIRVPAGRRPRRGPWSAAHAGAVDRPPGPAQP